VAEGAWGGGAAVFSALGELDRLVFYTLPGVALLAYLALAKGSLPKKRLPRFSKGDIPSLILGFPGLALMGLLTSLGGAAFEGPGGFQGFEPPANWPGWVILFLSCLGTGCLEESFFRFYLFRKLEIPLQGEWKSIIFSSLLFAVCHVYEGPWGAFNALCAAFLLSFLYLRTKSLPGIAAAHGFYNLFVYIFTARVY